MTIAPAQRALLWRSSRPRTSGNGKAYMGVKFETLFPGQAMDEEGEFGATVKDSACGSMRKKV